MTVPTALPAGWIQTFDGLFPALPPGDYTVGVTQTLAAPGSPSYSGTQAFTVQAPEFAIDTTLVSSQYPPAGGADQFGQVIPYLAIEDAALPWERALTPGSAPATEGDPQPWLALLLFAAGELIAPDDAIDPTATATVSELLAASPTVLKPALPTGWVSEDQLRSQCRTVTVSGAAFQTALPSPVEMGLLTHVRALDGATGPQQLAVFLANRLPAAPGAGAAAAAQRWYAQLVSLEGFAEYLGPNGKPLPTKPGTNDPQDVMLASLYGWSFVSLPETGFNFATYAEGLLASQSGAGSAALALPVPVGAQLPQPVGTRLSQGYAPLTLLAASGEQSFAWYRGPFVPQPAQTLPEPGVPPLPITAAASADALTIYLADEGVFDLSYATAWNAGRNLALEDGAFARALHSLRLRARGVAARLAQNLSQPQFAGETDASALLARNATRARFGSLMADRHAAAWHAALASVRDGDADPRASSGRFAPRTAPRRALPLSIVLAHPGAAEAIADASAEQIASVRTWLERSLLLEGLPFQHLVPDPRMLPVESIRFFYVDAGWLEAFVAGALSLAVHSGSDASLQAALLPYLAPDIDAAAGGISGLLIRSQLVADTPRLSVAASTGGAALPIVRDARPAAGVRLVLFRGIPDEVSFSQPSHGLIFGLEDGAVAPRALAGAAIGAQISGAAPVSAPLRATQPAAGGVLDATALAASLADACGVAPFASEATVLWNGAPLPTQSGGAGMLTATVSATLLATPGTASVAVSSGTASAPLSFTIDPAFSLDALVPALVRIGSDGFALTLVGEGFGSDAAAQWNGVALPTQFVSPQQLIAQVGATQVASAGSAQLTVLTGGRTTDAVALPIVAASPRIAAVTPAARTAGTAGFSLTVTGSGFAPGAGVWVDGTAMPTARTDDATLVASIGASIIAEVGTLQITVASGGSTSNAATLTVAAAGGAPVIGTISPTTTIANAGTIMLTVTGANFSSGAVVSFGGVALSTSYENEGELIATLDPATTAAGTSPVTVGQAAQTSAAVPFTVLPAAAPAAGLLVPDRAAAGSGPLTLAVYGGFGASALALQLVQAPQQQVFLPIASGNEP